MSNPDVIEGIFEAERHLRRVLALRAHYRSSVWAYDASRAALLLKTVDAEMLNWLVVTGEPGPSADAWLREAKVQIDRYAFEAALEAVVRVIKMIAVDRIAFVPMPKGPQ